MDTEDTLCVIDQDFNECSKHEGAASVQSAEKKYCLQEALIQSSVMTETLLIFNSWALPSRLQPKALKPNIS